MSQSSIIAAALIGGFFIYITVKGELPSYLALFFGTTASGAATSSGPSLGSVLASHTGNGTQAGGGSGLPTLRLLTSETPAHNTNTLEL